MQKNLLCYELLLVAMLFISPLKAQITGSATRQANSTYALDSNYHRSLQGDVSKDGFQIQRLAVKAGDIITTSAMVYEGKKPKGRFFKTLVKSVIPGIAAYQVVDRSPGVSSEAVVNKLPTISVGVAIVPGMIEVSKHSGKKGKPFLKLDAFNSAGNKLTSKAIFTTKAAQNDYEELNVSYMAEEDGFVDLMASKGNDPKSIFVIGDVIQRTLIEAERSARKPAPPTGTKPTTPPVVQTANMCTEWYLNTYVNGMLRDSHYLGTTCSSGGGDSGGGQIGGHTYGGGGTNLVETNSVAGGSTPPPPPSRNCQRCRELANNERDAKRNEARYKLAANLAVWCPVSGVSAGASAAAAVAWLNGAPGVGTLVDLGIGAATALFVDTECSLRNLTEWNAAKAAWENKYFQDMADCNSNFDCGF